MNWNLVKVGQHQSSMQPSWACRWKKFGTQELISFQFHQTVKLPYFKMKLLLFMLVEKEPNKSNSWPRSKNDQEWPSFGQKPLVPGQLSRSLSRIITLICWKVAVRKEFFYVGFCDINPKYYPYDSHNCLIQGLSYQPLNINLTYSNIIHSKMINNYHTKWLIGETKLTKVCLIAAQSSVMAAVFDRTYWWQFLGDRIDHHNKHSDIFDSITII